MKSNRTIILFLTLIFALLNIFSISIPKCLASSYLTFNHQCPKQVTIGTEFLIPILISPPSSSYDLSNINISISAHKSFIFLDNSTFYVMYLSGGSSIGHTFRINTNVNATSGIYYINFLIKYSYSNTNYQETIAYEIKLIKNPQITLEIFSPETLFSEGEFDIKVSIQNSGITAHNITINLILPKDALFEGRTTYYLSAIESYTKYDVVYRIKPKIINSLIYSQFIVNMAYYDEENNIHIENKISPVTLRPRSSFEISPNGGFWLGSIFISPVISFGTIISILIFVLGLKIRNKEKTKYYSATKYIIAFLSGIFITLFLIALIR
jgi:hypothetical protein